MQTNSKENFCPPRRRRSIDALETKTNKKKRASSTGENSSSCRDYFRLGFADQPVGIAANQSVLVET